MVEKKTCPICGREISKQGWAMHMANCSDKHGKEFVKWGNVGEGASTSGGEQSFRKEESGESKREGSGEDWGTILDD